MKSLTPARSDGKIRSSNIWIQRLLKFITLVLSLCSLLFGTITGLSRGIDLRFFQEAGQRWLEGGPLKSHGYPPYSVVAFSPLSLVPFDELCVLWLILNLVATVVCLYLTFEIWGKEWPRDARFYLSAMLLCWAPFRTTLRNGQLSLLITALLLGAILAYKRKKKIQAGLFLGLSLIKYTLSLPFLLYWLWRRQWKSVAIALLVPSILTLIFELHPRLVPTHAAINHDVGATPISIHNASFQINSAQTKMPRVTLVGNATADYFAAGIKHLLNNSSFLMGRTEIKTLICALVGDAWLGSLITGILVLAALVGMMVVFRMGPSCENTHFALLALFSLWSVYHRAYDAVLCLMPAALFMDYIVTAKHPKMGKICLAGLALFIIAIPRIFSIGAGLDQETLSVPFLGSTGLRIERFFVDVMPKLVSSEIGLTAQGFITQAGIHSERVLIFGLFWYLLASHWKENSLKVSPCTDSSLQNTTFQH